MLIEKNENDLSLQLLTWFNAITYKNGKKILNYDSWEYLHVSMKTAT